MEIAILVFIFKTYSFIFLFVISFSLPFVFLIRKNNTAILSILPITGFSFLLILLNWSHYLNLMNIGYKIIYGLSLFFIFFILIFNLINRKFRSIFNNYLKLTIFNYFFIFCVIYIFIYFQGNTFPYIPSYEVNHDPIAILSTAKYLNLHSTPTLGEVGGVANAVNLLKSGYPISFTLFLVLINSFLKEDFFNIVHLLNIFIYGLTYLMLIKIYEININLKNKKIFFLGALFSIFSYLGVQVVNQSFYNQTMLLPFLISSIYLTKKIFDSKNDKIVLLVFILILSGFLLSYGFTGLIWLGIFLIILNFFLIKNKVKKLYNINIFLLKTFLGSFLLILPFAIKLIKLFYFGLISNVREGSFFTALGNTLGYPNFLVALNTWPILDFRINQITKKFLIFAFLNTFILILFSFIGYWRSKLLNKKILINLFVLVMTGLIPILIIRFFLKSPYYYSKSLFYSSFIFSSLIGLGLVLCLKNLNNLPLKIISIFLIFLYFNNTMKSLNYFGRPPLDKFEELKTFSKQFNDSKIKEVVVIDDEDWAKYFLFNQGSCIAFARSFSCDIGYKKTEDNKIILDGKVNYYLIGDKYQKNITNLINAKLLYSGKYYSLYFYSL